jgi:hypothetical protein
MAELPFCNVCVYIGDKKTPLDKYKRQLNEAEIKAIGISRSIYCNNQYYEIESIAFNFQDSYTLEIFVKSL